MELELLTGCSATQRVHSLWKLEALLLVAVFRHKQAKKRGEPPAPAELNVSYKKGGPH